MHYQWPKIKRSEIKYTIFKLLAKKTLGPDKFSFRVLREAYTTIPELFNYLYPIFITNNYHPKYFKEATGVILKKPQTTKLPYRNYTLPKAYRIISLLNCLAKVIEKIVARRLAVITEFKTLLHMHQIGGRRQKSAINAVIILIQKMQANWRTKKRGFITSVLALNIKNTYLTVRAASYAKICIQIKLSTELIK
jgi:hypothetical protein